MPLSSIKQNSAIHIDENRVNGQGNKKDVILSECARCEKEEQGYKVYTKAVSELKPAIGTVHEKRNPDCDQTDTAYYFFQDGDVPLKEIGKADQNYRGYYPDRSAVTLELNQSGLGIKKRKLDEILVDIG
jgi:hypothetical protein